MPSNYVLLEKVTVGAAGASSVTFTNIPQTGYTDLVLKSSIRATAATSGGFLTFNGNTSGYSELLLYGNGSITGSVTNTAAGFVWVFETVLSTYTANTFSSGEILIPNYTSSNIKTVSVENVLENNATSSDQYLVAGTWNNTAAITSINIASGSNFAANSTFYLYGVAKFGVEPVIAPKATGGNTIMTDGTYWYHTFISSGTFTPNTSLTCDYLVVAGGGGGGTGGGGGGGAGGLRSTVTATGGGGSLESALSLLSNTNYTVTIGAGGAGGAGGPGGGGAGYRVGVRGSNSVFSTITSTGGGGGGSLRDGELATSGGSGGGGVTGPTPNIPGAAGTANQGFRGGNANASALYAGAGGGGAGAQGGDVSNQVTAGGAGVAVSISGSSVTYAGGGGGGSQNSYNTAPVTGGGAGGSGGGGAGSGSADGTSGTANLGGGGGGGGYIGGNTSSGGNGGSGIVIVRYLVA